MTDDELIEKILHDLHNLDAPGVNTDFIKAADTTGGTDDKRLAKIRRRLDEENLCSFGKFSMSITSLGSQVVEDGGYIVYLARMNKHYAYEEEKERIQFENSKIELAKNKWEYRMRWITFIIAVAAFIMSFVSLFISK